MPRDPLVDFMAAQGQRTALYVFESGEFVKVGISANVKRRLSEATKLNPHPTRCAMFRRVHHHFAREAEAAVHAFLADKKHRGEWFRCSVEDVRPVILTACSIVQTKEYALGKRVLALRDEVMANPAAYSRPYVSNVLRAARAVRERKRYVSA